MNMPFLAILFGVFLDALGTIGFLATGATHFTALIPSVFGTVILLAGILSKILPGMRMHFMHVAALTGLIGLLGGFGMGLPKLPAVLAGTAERPVAVWLQLSMGTLCLIFLILCVKSFIDARRMRETEVR